jgi:pilus assembly protein CpaB
MNWKTFVPLLLAIALGLVAAKVARDTLNRQHQPAQQGNFASIVITKHSMAPGQELTADDLTVGQVSPDSKPEQSFDNIADLLNRTARVEMVKGQAIVEPLLAERGAGSGLQALVPAGMRAITIEVNEFSGVGNMVAPGCRVDVVATIQANGGSEMSARTIVQDVKVTAVGQRVTAKPDPKDDPTQQVVFRSVTILATPGEVEAIELANTTGRPWLVLRGNKDDEKVETNGITLTELRGKIGSFGQRNDPFTTVSLPTSPSTRPSFEPVAMNTRTVEVIRGGAVSSVTLTLPTLRGGDVTGGKDEQREINDPQ